MNKLTSIRIKQNDGTYSDDIIIQVLSDNVICEDDLTLTEVLNSLNTSISNSQSAIETNTTNIMMQTGRIDNFVSLAQGSTTGDAELQDVRVKVDGSISSTAGNAVRQQILDVSSLINEVNERLDDNDTILSNFVDGAYVEDGVAYFTNNGTVMFSITGIGGGSGGGGSVTNAVLTVTNQTGWLSKTIAKGSPCPIMLEWSSIEDGMPTGPGTLKVTTNGIVRTTMNIAQGVVTIDISKFLSQEKNNVRISISDVYGSTRTINFSVTMVSFSISSSFDNSMPFNGAITFQYTPIGAVDKTVYFYVDGTLIGTQETPVSNRQLSYRIPAQSHGAHNLRVYFEAVINSETITSNELYYEFASIDENSIIPIIYSDFNTSVVDQYTSIVIPYTVYTPKSLTSDITISINNSIVSRQTVNRTQQSYTYRALQAGNLALTITCDNIVKTFNILVESSTISVKAETENLVLHLSSAGRSNNEANPSLWKYNNISASLTNFNWVSDGWINDTDGITVLRVAGDARVTIPYKPFASDFRGTGKTIEIEFATRDVRNYDAVIMSCMSGGRGLNITAQKAMLKSEQSEISTQYKEDEHVRVTFVTEKRSENRLLLIYINGIASGAIQYPSDDDFSQTNPVDILIGSNDCTMDIYCIRVYDNDLNRFQVLENWIADKQIGLEMIDTFLHNNVFDAYGNIVIDQLPKDLPYMIIEASELPQYKGDKKIVTGSYVDPVNSSKSFTFTECQINVQGTSSAPYARKNYDMQFKGGFELADGHKENYALRNTVVPFNRFVLKADVASSEGANNVELVRLYCDTCPFETREMKMDPRVRQGIDGFPIVLFWHNITTDTMQFMGKYNFNLPKRAPEPYGYSGNMESWEFQNNTSDLMLFKTDYFDETMYTDPETGDSKELWRYDYEARFPSDEWTNYAKLQELQSFIVSTDRTKATNEIFSTPIVYNGETFSSDTEAYRLAKFKAEFGNYAEIDSFIFYYIFTELFLMVDSRAKNLFIGFSGSDTNPSLGLTIDRKAVAEPYDMDTAIGTNNEGSLVFDYSLEDTDTLTGGAYIFNGQNSVLWCNLRDAFKTEIVNMYKTLRSAGTLSYNEIQNRFKTHQDKWSEAIFNEDAWFKYIDPLIAPDPGKSPTDIYLPMMQGSKAEQRKWWLYNRFRYMDSKWNAGDALSDLIQLRGYAKADITVTPYADVYPTVKYGSYLVQKRGHRNQATTLECPIDNVNDTEIYIYSASQLSDIGDLSPLKVGFADLSMATRLQNLKIGDSDPNYSNPNLGVGSNTLSLGNNVLLKTLDVRNCIALGTGNQKSVDISGCTNIEEIYFDGTAIQGLTLPQGGIIKKIHLPGTMTNLTLVNQSAITEFIMPSFENISSLRLENVSDAVNVRSILSSIPTGSRVRVIGFYWEAVDSNEIDEMIALFDSMRGLDEYGNNVETAQISGTIHTDSLTGTQIASYNQRYPYLRVIANHVISTLTYASYDGTVIYKNVTCIDGVPQDVAPINPTREPTAQYSYTFVGWNRSQNAEIAQDNAAEDVIANRTIYAAYTKTINSYTVRFYNENTLLQIVNNVNYGASATYTGAIPVHPTEPDNYEFFGWSPSPNNISGTTDCYATWTFVGSATLKTIARTIKEVDSSEITKVGDYAFTYCLSLTTVNLPSASIIGEYAFSTCISLTTVSLPEVTTIERNAFYGCRNLQEISLPLATYIGSSAFNWCTKISSVNLPSVTYIDQYAFNACSSLTTVSLPALTSLGNCAFTSCINLTTVNMPVVTSIGNSVFSGLGKLVTISLPSATYLGLGAFGNCGSLTTVDLPALTSTAGAVFMNCTKLTTVSMPALTRVEGDVFKGCTNLTKISLPAASQLWSSAFTGCTKLSQIYLLSSNLCSLIYANAFNSTPLSASSYLGYFGSIYVPSSLVSDYKTANNWSAYSDRITAYREE